MIEKISKHLFSYSVAFLVLFQILIYVIEPFIKNPNKFFIISTLIIIIIFLIYYKKEKPNKKSIIYLIICIGVLLRNLYIMKTNIYTRQHDV